MPHDYSLVSIYFLSYVKLFKEQATPGAVETGGELSKSLQQKLDDLR